MKKITGFILLVAACVPAVLAAAGAPSIPAAFMEQLAKGINARDLAAVRKLTHPDTLKCMTPETQAYYGWLLWRDGSKRYVIPKEYKVDPAPPINIQSYEPQGTQKALLHWPVQPDSGARFTYSPAPKTSIQRIFEITLKDGKALLVMDCPTADGLEKFRKIAQKDAARKQKLARLWKSMDPADQQAFELMASQGMKFEIMNGAEQKYNLNEDESLAFLDMIEYGDTP